MGYSQDIKQSPYFISYVGVEYSIDAVTNYNCNPYNGKNVKPRAADSTYSSELLPDIYSTESDTSLWPSIYEEKGILTHNLFGEEQPAERCGNYSEYANFSKTMVSIQQNCSVYRNKKIDFNGAKICTNVKKGESIAITNKLKWLYESIHKELLQQAIRNDIEKPGIEELSNVFPGKTPTGSMPDYNTDTGEPNGNILVKNDIILDLNNALMLYNETVPEIKIKLKIVNADDSINKLILNYKTYYIDDCVCYSDCNSYSVCYCYGNCNHY